MLVNRHHVTEASITALTPYSAQKEEIKKRLQDKKLLTIPVKTITESQGTDVYSVSAKHQFHIICLVTTQMRSRPVRDTPVRTPPRSLDDMDGRGWEVWGWVANG